MAGTVRDSSASLARGAAVMTIATAVSRVTGFVRVVVLAAAMGGTFLTNTYQTANTAPNVVFELVAAGVLTSIFVPTFVEYLVRGARDEGWDAANALTTMALLGLTAISLLLALGAGPIMRLLTIGVADADVRAREVELGASFLRLFAPQVVFYGAGMIMTGALHAYRRFALPAIAPIFNNVVVIAVYGTYAVMRAGRDPSLATITDGERWLLGAGTTMGVVAMTVCLVPQLARLGWRFRFRFDASHPAVRKAARLGVWALGYAGGYQAGLVVVLVLGNRVDGGVAAYQWAYTFFYLPHALFAIPVFNALFPAMSEHAVKGDAAALVGRLRDGLAMLGFVLLPLAALLVAAAEPLARVTLRYGAMSAGDADLVARVLVGFALGLPAYSSFLVYTRAFYALGDTRTPTLVNVVAVALASAAGAVLFFALDDEWSVFGLSLGHSIGFTAGAVVLARAFARRAGARGATLYRASLLRSSVVSLAALGAMLAAHAVVPDESHVAAFADLVVTAAAGAAVYVAAMRALGSPELSKLVALAAPLRRRLGRAPG
ncbi:MAG TPA: murein biosynthesis integral membrane protein MurJ [Actinomycetota bacterium]|nr:murein biosynthesis integral membrane protein MurJ [Actinomycetota bacterium]